ncbi:MAG: hypothetical protein GIW96_05765 [Candidatus Eremiobacteraeota bacterium]|nr:hypothetical protein [Candidatus Eremiobacteraeota bacterium]
MVRAAVDDLKHPGAMLHGALHAHRQHTILSRYDLNKEPLATVARSLGISLRKCYYERRAAMARVAASLGGAAMSSKVAVDDGDAVVRDGAEPLIEDEQTAEVLSELGRFDLAIQILERIIERAPEDHARVAGYSLRLMHILCEKGEVNNAKLVFERVQRLRCMVASSVSADLCLDAHCDYAAAELSFYAGRPLESIVSARCAAARMLPLARSGGDRARLLRIEILQFLGDIETELGFMHEAIRDYNDALVIAEGGVNARQHCELLLHIGYAEALLPGRLQCARERNAHALKMAATKGLLPQVARAHMNEAIALHYLGSYKAALAHLEHALPIVTAICARSERTRLAMLQARTLGACGFPRRALAALRSLDSAAAYDNPTPRHYALFLEAEMLERLGDFAGAVTAATASVAGYRAIQNDRGVGMAMLEAARAHERSGNSKAAARTLSDALELLERVNNPFYLGSALTCRARLTGKREHREAATEILRSLTG